MSVFNTNLLKKLIDDQTAAYLRGLDRETQTAMVVWIDQAELWLEERCPGAADYRRSDVQATQSDGD